MKCLLRKEVADVAEKDRAAGLDRSHCTFQNLQQVVDVREVLNDGIQNDGVKSFILEAGEVFRGPLKQLHMLQVPCRANLLDVAQCVWREVNGPIFTAMRRDAREQQAGAATDFEHALWFQTEDASDRLVHPLMHFFNGNRLAGVTAVPTSEIERGIG